MQTQLTTSEVRFQEIKPGYRVSDDGKVWSCVKQRRGDKLFLGEWREMKATPQSRGHMTVFLGRKDQRFVHRLVLEAFVGPCPPGMECRHFPDRNPANNRLDNLSWGTPKENHADSIEHGTAYHLRPESHEHAAHLWDHVEHKSGEKHHRAKLSDEQVQIIRAVIDPAQKDGRATRLAEIWDVTPAAIRMVARGIRRCSG